MKKILTAIFAVTVILTAAAGCGKSADGQIMEEVLRDIPTVTETTVTKDDNSSAADVETFTTTAATTSERETAAEETEAAFDYDASMFPEGRWVDVTDTDETFYKFDEGEQLEVGLQTHSIFGKYTFEDNLLTLIFDIGSDTANHVECAFDVQQEENGFRLYYNSEKSMGAVDLPDMDSVSNTADQELIVGLTNLFSGFESRGSIFLEYYEIWYADRY